MSKNILNKLFQTFHNKIKKKKKFYLKNISKIAVLGIPYVGSVTFQTFLNFSLSLYILKKWWKKLYRIDTCTRIGYENKTRYCLAFFVVFLNLFHDWKELSKLIYLMFLFSYTQNGQRHSLWTWFHYSNSTRIINIVTSFSTVAIQY